MPPQPDGRAATSAMQRAFSHGFYVTVCIASLATSPGAPDPIVCKPFALYKLDDLVALDLAEADLGGSAALNSTSR